MAGKGTTDKYVPHQVRPSRQGTQSVRLPRAVQQQNREGRGLPHGGKRVKKEN